MRGTKWAAAAGAYYCRFDSFNSEPKGGDVRTPSLAEAAEIARRYGLGVSAESFPLDAEKVSPRTFRKRSRRANGAHPS